MLYAFLLIESCATTWTVYNNTWTRTVELVNDPGGTTVEKCLKNCLSDARCLAVEYDTWSVDSKFNCWVHHNMTSLNQNEAKQGTDLFIINRCKGDLYLYFVVCIILIYVFTSYFILNHIQIIISSIKSVAF